MENKLTREQTLTMLTDIVEDKNGKTNKRCPLCNSQVIVEHHGSSGAYKCEKGCFTLRFRGI